MSARYIPSPLLPSSALLPAANLKTTPSGSRYASRTPFLVIPDLVHILFFECLDNLSSHRGFDLLCIYIVTHFSCVSETSCCFCSPCQYKQYKQDSIRL